MTVLEATTRRLDLLFEEFDNIYVSFSGGKDSGVLLNLCLDHIRSRSLKRRIGVFHIDYEVQYGMTTDYVDRTLAANGDTIDVYRICVPFKVPTCTSMYQSYWRPWEEEKRELWARPMPEGVLTRERFPFYRDDMWDYEFQERFSQWLHEQVGARRTACLVGIRTQESFNRWLAIHSSRNYRNYRGLDWTSEVGDNVYNAYPIFDWKTTDIWTANGTFHWDYNRLYDLYYRAGVPLDKQRVASPFLSTAQENLRLYRVIEPDTWGRMIGRVNGVNFAGIYGGTTAMGWSSIRLPQGHTWRSYMYFLLGTLPEETRQGYIDKLETSIRFWRERGGVLSCETIEKLRAAGVKFEVMPDTNYKTDKRPVRMEYLDDVDIAEFREIPTYKRMCVCILKNDHLCKYMGFSQTKHEMARRKNIMEKYRNIL
ncbi:MAG: DUF3440 domain-containing protein [Rikenellaceae bacterium]|jgi:predicted phosphoadenosine phosphosulfate sulfurtransferase|nr:DUF3440 domain-containing protein [Rikenellaceae bacterium]